MKITDVYVAPRSCKYVTGNRKVARPATPEIKAVKGKPAHTDKDGKLISKAVPDIKAVPAQDAQAGEQQMWIWAESMVILKEIEARMRDAGVNPTEGEALIDKLDKNFTYRGFDVSKKIGQCYSAPNRGVFQDAFKKVKSKDHYNKNGAAILHADKLEKNRKKEAEKREAEKKADKKKEGAEVKTKKKLAANTKKKSSKKKDTDW